MTETYKLIEPPQSVGEWILPGSVPALGFRIQAYKRPRWLTRKLMKVLVEWEWKDSKPENETL